MKDILIIIASIMFAALRIAGFKDPAFQAFAHLWVGGLFVAWLMNKRWFYGAWFWGLCAVEVIQASIDHGLAEKIRELL